LPWVFVGQLVLILLGPMLFFTASGQFLSLAFRRGITGSVLNLLLGLFIWVGLWIILGLVGWFGDFVDQEWWEEAFKVPYSLNPLLMAGSACSPAIRMQFARNLQYDMVESSVTSLEFNTWLVVAFFIYVGLTVAILMGTVASFRRLSGRSS
jgi:hypothetical protein